MWQAYGPHEKHQCETCLRFMEESLNHSLHFHIWILSENIPSFASFEAPEGAKDTHYSLMQGTQCALIIRQGAAQGYKPNSHMRTSGGHHRDNANGQDGGIRQTNDMGHWLRVFC